MRFPCMLCVLQALLQYTLSSSLAAKAAAASQADGSEPQQQPDSAAALQQQLHTGEGFDAEQVSTPGGTCTSDWSHFAIGRFLVYTYCRLSATAVSPHSTGVMWSCTADQPSCSLLTSSTLPLTVLRAQVWLQLELLLNPLEKRTRKLMRQLESSGGQYPPQLLDPEVEAGLDQLLEGEQSAGSEDEGSQGSEGSEDDQGLGSDADQGFGEFEEDSEGLGMDGDELMEEDGDAAGRKQQRKQKSKQKQPPAVEDRWVVLCGGDLRC